MYTDPKNTSKQMRPAGQQSGFTVKIVNKPVHVQALQKGLLTPDDLLENRCFRTRDV